MVELELQLPGDELAPFGTSLASRGQAQSSCWGQRVPDTTLFPRLIQSHVPVVAMPGNLRTLGSSPRGMFALA